MHSLSDSTEQSQKCENNDDTCKCTSIIVGRSNEYSCIPSSSNTDISEWGENTQNLHVLGSDVYIYTHKTDRHSKLDEKSRHGIFMGYDEENTTYYRVYDMTDSKVKVVRDLRVFDNEFNQMLEL